MAQLLAGRPARDRPLAGGRVAVGNANAARRSTPERWRQSGWIGRGGDLGYFEESRDALLAEGRAVAGEAWGRVWREEEWRAGVNERAVRTE